MFVLFVVTIQTFEISTKPSIIASLRQIRRKKRKTDSSYLNSGILDQIELKLKQRKFLHSVSFSNSLATIFFNIRRYLDVNVRIKGFFVSTVFAASSNSFERVHKDFKFVGKKIETPFLVLVSWRGTDFVSPHLFPSIVVASTRCFTCCCCFWCCCCCLSCCCLSLQTLAENNN